MNDKALANMPKAIQMLSTDSMRQQLQAAIPRSVSKYLTPDRMTRICLTEMRKVPALKKCDPHSVVGSLVVAAQMGLEPGGVTGHCYLVPFKGECQLIVGYRGMVALARRSGQVEQVNVIAVRKNDEFDYGLGLDPYITHKPDDDVAPAKDGSDITHVYAVAKLVGGGVQFEIMTRGQVENIRSFSQMKDRGPWKDHWEAMAKKTVVRRMFKMLPVSVEMDFAVGADELAEAGKQDAASFIEGEFEYDDPVEAAKEAMQKDPNESNANNGEIPMMTNDSVDKCLKAIPGYDMDSVTDLWADLQTVPKARQQEFLAALTERKRELEGGQQTEDL